MKSDLLYNDAIDPFWGIEKIGREAKNKQNSDVVHCIFPNQKKVHRPSICFLP